MYKKTKISTITLITILTISAILATLPTANAQDLIMNVSTQGILGFNIDVDLNGPRSQLEGMNFAYKPPGATDFIHTTDPLVDNEPGLPGERYVTDPGGDLDIDWTPTDGPGDYEVKWVLNSTGAESNVVTISVLSEVLVTSYPYLGIIPNPIGVDQVALLHVGMNRPAGYAGDGYTGLTVAVEKPDGTTQTLGPFTTDSTGGTGTTFIPTIVGTYKLKTVFPKQQAPWNGISYTAAESAVTELVVQEDPIAYHPGYPLPTEYWVRPIDAQLREWNTIAGNWLQTPNGLFAPNNDYAPDTAHILWTKPLAIGGVVGGNVGEHSFTMGDAYEGKFGSRFILAGRLYYTEGGSRGLEHEVTHCVDLHTGEEIWSKVFLDNRSISFAQTLYWDAFNMHGAFPYLWITRGRTWHAFDAYSGDWRFTIENMPSGTRMMGPDGGIYIVNVNTRAGTMRLWAMDGDIRARSGSSAGSWGNAMEGDVHDANDWDDCWLWEKSIPTDIPGRVVRAWYGDRVILETTSQTEVSLTGLSLAEGSEGQLLFKNTWQAPAYWEDGDVSVPGFGLPWLLWSELDHVAVLWVKETQENYGFSLETGDKLWGPTAPQYYIDAIDDQHNAARAFGYGNFYSISLSGIVYCYDIQTGELKWTYEAEDPYQEFLHSNNWWGRPVFVTDGKIYVGSLEHSPIDPRPRGAPFYCLDAETGELLWRADGLFRQTRWGGRAIIGDSIIAAMDTYDQRLYAIGKGSSQTTVTAPDIGVAQGSSIMIRGTVMDVSPGTTSSQVALRFPKGVPAVSDASMSDWMAYVYKQFPMPAATGVDVTIDVIDANGNFRNIGTATSDASGFYSLAWTPDIHGSYNVYATFAGTGGYYGSYAETAFVVDQALQATPAPTPTPAPMTDTYLTGSTIAIIAAIAIAVFLLLRKK
jgi:outer membrane protein assembly factor BamB